LVLLIGCVGVLAELAAMLRALVFILGRSSAVTSRHFLDAQYTIHIGEFSTIAGVRSTIFSHSMNLYNCKQGGSPVVIGDYAFVGSNALILPGVNIADRVIVAAGATLTKSE
jgi:acetyltransferase-like isoleucine patch superfamily enzyme